MTKAADGPLLFAKYAYPPNARGYCGPDDHRAVGEYLANGVADPGLGHLARGFDGAWPYLELIAAASQITDPLDRRVVEAYWVGNGLLGNVRLGDFGAHLDERFRRRAGSGWENIAGPLPHGVLPHHSFHVFCVYPWAGLLRAGRADPSLEILDRCRISWGQVRAAVNRVVVVRCRPLAWDGARLSLGRPALRTVAAGFAADPRPGDWVSLHWDTVCDRLTPAQVHALRDVTARHLRLAGLALGTAALNTGP